MTNVSRRGAHHLGFTFFVNLASVVWISLRALFALLPFSPLAQAWFTPSQLSVFLTFDALGWLAAPIHAIGSLKYLCQFQDCSMVCLGLTDLHAKPGGNHLDGNRDQTITKGL